MALAALAQSLVAALRLRRRAGERLPIWAHAHRSPTDERPFATASEYRASSSRATSPRAGARSPRTPPARAQGRTPTTAGCDAGLSLPLAAPRAQRRDPAARRGGLRGFAGLLLQPGRRDRTPVRCLTPPPSRIDPASVEELCLDAALRRERSPTSVVSRRRLPGFRGPTVWRRVSEHLQACAPPPAREIGQSRDSAAHRSAPSCVPPRRRRARARRVRRRTTRTTRLSRSRRFRPAGYTRFVP